jgi:hypothetical protein
MVHSLKGDLDFCTNFQVSFSMQFDSAQSSCLKSTLVFVQSLSAGASIILEAIVL